MKIANILLLSASIVALAACGKTQPDTANPGDGAAPTTEEPATEEPAAEEPATEEPAAEEAAAEEPAAE
jgi:predicted small lipoprotein YifL